MKAADFPYKGKLVVFTSFYECRAYAPYTKSMVDLAIILERLGVNWDYWASMGDFHIERSINEAYTRFLRDEEATDILCIDSDEGFSAESVLRLLMHPDEVVAGCYRMKNSWHNWTGLWQHDKETGQPRGRVLNDGTALLKADRVPWGFLRVKKPALQRYVAHFPDLKFKGRNGDEYIFCQQQYINGEFFSQDCVFSERLKQCGCDLWIDPNITIGHWGLTNHEGNLHEYLVALKGSQDVKNNPEAAFAVVAEMAKEIESRKAA